MREFEQWDGFTGRLWKEGIDVAKMLGISKEIIEGAQKYIK